MPTTPNAVSHSTLPSANPSVVFRTVSDGAVLLHMGREIYFGLNAVGALVWKALPVCSDFDDLCATIGRDYPAIDPQMIRTDVAALLAQLEENQLVLPPG
ncbi:MAG TPA: PqqD family protein [Gemmatimonadaceae bacterium]|nr:PqqD family protein [Gemmatimonadaceae bacterium]